MADAQSNGDIPERVARLEEQVRGSERLADERDVRYERTFRASDRAVELALAAKQDRTSFLWAMFGKFR